MTQVQPSKFIPVVDTVATFRTCAMLGYAQVAYIQGNNSLYAFAPGSNEADNGTTYLHDVDGNVWALSTPLGNDPYDPADVDITGGVIEDLNSFAMTVSSASTSGSVSVEPMSVATTMTGIGGVGGRAHFTLNTNVALGAWSNALKGEVVYGAAGKTTGLGSAVLGEMTLSAGTNAGTYAPLELELNMGAGALTGTASSLIYGSVNGAAATTFDANGFLLNIAGLTAGASNLLATGTTLGTAAASLKIKIGSTTYYLGLYSGPIT